MRPQKRVVTERTLQRDARGVVLLAAILLTATIVAFGQAVVATVAPDLAGPVPMTHPTAAP